MVAENGGEFGRRHRTVIGAQFAVGLAVDAGTQKYDAGIGFGRMQCESGRRAGMNADAGDGRHDPSASFAGRRVRPSSCLRPTPYGQTTRAKYFANDDGHLNVRGTHSVYRQGLADARPPGTSIPQNIPSTEETLPASVAIRPIHAFLPTVTFFRPQSCRLLAAKSLARLHLAKCKIRPGAWSAAERIAPDYFR